MLTKPPLLLRCSVGVGLATAALTSALRATPQGPEFPGLGGLHLPAVTFGTPEAPVPPTAPPVDDAPPGPPSTPRVERVGSALSVTADVLAPPAIPRAVTFTVTSTESRSDETTRSAPGRHTQQDERRGFDDREAQPRRVRWEPTPDGPDGPAEHWSRGGRHVAGPGTATPRRTGRHAAQVLLSGAPGDDT